MEKQFFRCYELFYKIGKELPTELKAKYYEALMEYGLYGTEPTDPVIKALLLWPMYSIDKSDELSVIRSELWKKHKGNQYTKGDSRREAQKKSVEQNGTELEQNGTWSIRSNKKNKEDIEDIRSNNKEKINKKKYLDFVYLAEEEHTKLINLYGIKQTDELIDKLNNYIGSTWKRYKSHYYTILNRAKKETTTAPKQNEILKERERLRIRQEAEQYFNSNGSTNGKTQDTTSNRRADISCN